MSNPKPTVRVRPYAEEAPFGLSWRRVEFLDESGRTVLDLSEAETIGLARAIAAAIFHRRESTVYLTTKGKE